MASFRLYRHGVSYEVLVDDADLERVLIRVRKLGPWMLAPHGRKGKLRVYRAVRDEGRVIGQQQLHRFILGFKEGDPDVDHRNGDPLDNRRENLRPATDAQNQANRAKKENCRSEYKGVTFCRGRKSKPWQASCGNHKTGFIGRFATEMEAARAYNERAKNLYGDYALLNVLPPLSVAEGSTQITGRADHSAPS